MRGNTMIRLGALLALTPFQALACDWSGTTVTHTPGGDLATIHLHNQLSHIVADTTTCELVIDGVQVVVSWDHRNNTDPDTVVVTVPPGWEAVPPYAIIDENEDVDIVIRALVMG
jgi:cation transporter-like permease